MKLDKKVDEILYMMGDKAFTLYVGICEWFSPTEGEYTGGGSSGNVMYIGPSLRERVRKRLNGEYLQNPGTLSAKSAFGNDWIENIIRYDSPHIKVSIRIIQKK